MVNFLIGLVIGTIPGAVGMFLWMDYLNKRVKTEGDLIRYCDSLCGDCEKCIRKTECDTFRKRNGIRPYGMSNEFLSDFYKYEYENNKNKTL